MSSKSIILGSGAAIAASLFAAFLITSPPLSFGSAEAATPASSAVITAASGADCQQQNWPYIERSCVAFGSDDRKVRVIEIDNVSQKVAGTINSATGTDTVAISPVAPKVQEMKALAFAPEPMVAPAASAVGNAPSQTKKIEKRSSRVAAAPRPAVQELERPQIVERVVYRRGYDAYAASY